MAKPRPPTKRRCATCGAHYVSRPRREPVCLTCDIRQSAANGESSATIATRLGLPRFLIEATVERCG